MATIGIYSMVATLLWGGSRSAIHLTIEHSAAVRALDPGDGVSIGVLGFLLAVASSATAPPGRSGTCSSTRSG
jgi:hypothetical protein